LPCISKFINNGQALLLVGRSKKQFCRSRLSDCEREQDIPIEIKGGAAGKLRSMHLLLKSYPQIDQGFALSSAPFGQLPDQKLTFLPLYYAYGLVKDTDPN
jgi:hypothetical protein